MSVPRILADTTPLRESRDFARLWAGFTVANLGSQISVVAVGLQVYHLTQSTFAVGLLGLCALVPLVVLGLYGGALADQHDRRKVAFYASLVMWLVSMGIAAQAWLHVESVELLYGLVAVQSAAAAINSPARSSIVPRLLPTHLLPAANALMGMQWNIALLGGPMIGAALVAWVGFAPTYTIDVATFVFALYALLHLPPIAPERNGKSVAGNGSGRMRGWSSVVDGLRFLATRPNIRMTFFLDLCAMVLAMPRVLFPALGAVVLGGGATTTGALTTAIAAGSLLAAVLSGPLGRIRRQGKAIAISVASWGLSIVAFGVVIVAAGRSHPNAIVWWALIAAIVALMWAGASDNVSMVLRNTVLQAATPDELRGRLQGIFTVVVAGGPRLGDLWLGTEAEWFGEGWAAVIGGVCCVLGVVALMLWQPRFLRYDARHPEP